MAGPASFAISAFAPTATTRPSRTAIASTVRNAGSTVTIRPVWKMWLGAGAGWKPAVASSNSTIGITRIIGGSGR